MKLFMSQQSLKVKYNDKKGHKNSISSISIKKDNPNVFLTSSHDTTIKKFDINEIICWLQHQYWLDLDSNTSSKGCP